MWNMAGVVISYQYSKSNLITNILQMIFSGQGNLIPKNKNPAETTGFGVRPGCI